ncbi:DnaJ C-terminal domain-containing protein [Brachybacterium saurashtrense]|uniref:J domain-containing protein n=1 Tax=Brachybacterium saurashtrense TaxID=556288 RepID=A0A345YLF7_9MICO|nr:DnaJ C-terminal domain-containing protein [Brachybacterium saurashtrense]AXK44759.1 J domain-containing protein [Brachybacterium saurashtrense]RRR23371.1 J domain-containing protein [Brachybacterium saurashtrense]
MSGQDWLDKDFYAVLGVSKDADAKEIKKAYRTQARKHHPDHHPDDPKAEERFKEIGEAYSVLNDPEQRQQYDAIRAMGSGGARFSAGQGGPGGAGFEDIFSSMFGGGGQAGPRPTAGGADAPDIEDLLRMFGGQGGGFPGGGAGPAGFGGQRAPAKGSDISARTRLSFRDAALGTEVRLTVDGRTLTARIPAGVHDGQKIRLRGKGRPGPGGAPAGDLLLTLDVTPHPVWSADGANLRLTVPLSFDEAVLGTRLSVPLLDGGTVSVKVPAGTPSGRTLRVRGKGLVTAKSTGDLLVTVEVAVPTHVEGKAEQAVKDLREALAGEDPRAGLAEAAAR